MPRQNNLDELAKKLDGDEFLRDKTKAVEFMGNFIRESFQDDYYLDDRDKCYQRLGKIGGETASEILRDAIYSEPNYNGKFIALRGYVMINQEKSISLLHETIVYPDSYVREETYKFLAQFKDASAISLLEKELEDFTEFGNKCPSDILWLRARIAGALYKLTGEKVYSVIESEAEDLNLQFGKYYQQGKEAEYDGLYRKFDSKIKKRMQSLKQK